MPRKQTVRARDVKDLMRREIGDASRRLRAAELGDEEIHRARKDLKRARANLRLLRPALTKKRYALENAALRDAARPLGVVRDARVMVDTVDALLKGETHDTRRALLMKIRALLEEARVSASREAQDARIAETSAAALEVVWQRVENTRVPPQGKAVLRKGIRNIYDGGRKALARVRADCTAENLHDWRKQVKYLGQAIESLALREAPHAARLAKRVEGLADALGRDHDLVVLEEKVVQLHGRSSARQGVSAQIAARRKALQSAALEAGRAVFKSKPKAFVKRVTSL